MERNVVIAVILSAVVILASAVINQMHFMSQVRQVLSPVDGKSFERLSPAFRHHPRSTA